MMVAQTIVSLVVNAGFAQANFTMPIMVPLSDILGMSRQTAIVAFQCGNGITHALLPTYTTLIASLAVARVPFKKWVKFAFKTVMITWVVGLIFTMSATIIIY